MFCAKILYKNNFAPKYSTKIILRQNVQLKPFGNKRVYAKIKSFKLN